MTLKLSGSASARVTLRPQAPFLNLSLSPAQMLIGLCGAELVGPDSVGASEGFLGWIAYLGAANAGACTKRHAQKGAVGRWHVLKAQASQHVFGGSVLASQPVVPPRL